jgi:hypothetical protein
VKSSSSSSNLREEGELEEAAGKALDRQAVRRLKEGVHELLDMLQEPKDV